MITAKQAQEQSLSQEDIEFYQKFQDAVIQDAINSKASDAPFLAYLYGSDLKDILKRYGVEYTEEDIKRLCQLGKFFFALLKPYTDAGYVRRWGVYNHPANERLSWDGSRSEL